MERVPLSKKLHLDFPLLLLILAVMLFAQIVLYSASAESMSMVEKQAINIVIALGVMLIFAQIPPHYYKQISAYIYILGMLLLLAVLFMGDIGKGAQRWLDLGVLRFQPSEFLKIGCPLMLAWYLDRRELPLRPSTLLISGLLILTPAALVVKQPDLGTAILIAASGFFVIFLAGIHFKILMGLMIAVLTSAYPAWLLLHDYQKKRILTFLAPEQDPMGSGYHILQSKIAIGSGGIFGKGWLNGSQAYLQFLPEKTTDFIFAVLSEEFGLLGALLLLILYALIIARCLHISMYAQDTFCRLLAGSLSLSFFAYVFINIGMVSGLLPVVGVPLPLVSYGGTALVTLMAAFGIIMSIKTHPHLLQT
jgi:rod shape determining protein RodA